MDEMSHAIKKMTTSGNPTDRRFLKTYHIRKARLHDSEFRLAKTLAKQYLEEL